MKEGAPAGKRSVAEPCLPSAKEGGIEGREGILGGSPALSMERITALCSREIHPPVRAGQPLPGPGGEMLRPVHHAVQGCAGPKGGGSSMTWSFTSTVVAKIYVFCALFLRRQSEGVQKGLLPPFGRRAAFPRRVLIILLKS